MGEKKLEQKPSQESLSTVTEEKTETTTSWQPATPTGLGAGPRGGAPFVGLFDESIGSHRAQPSWQSAQPSGAPRTSLIGTSRPAPWQPAQPRGSSGAPRIGSSRIGSSRTTAPVDLGYTSIPRDIDLGAPASTNAPIDSGYSDPTLAAANLGYTADFTSHIPAANAPAPSSGSPLSTRGYKTKPMEDIEELKNEQEDATGIRGPASVWNKTVHNEDKNAPTIKTIATHYMTPEEKAASEVHFQNGKMLDAEGKSLDTSGATGTGTQWKQGQGKHIFAMTESGAIRQADPWANKKIEQRDNGGHLGFINHSSFVSGEAVAGAGELKVVDGDVHQVSDQSGHYRPGGEITAQVLDELERNQVNLDNVDVKLVGKKTVKDKENLGKYKMQDPLYVSANQFREHDPATAESKIRREKKALKKELQASVEARRNRLDIADSEPVKQFERIRDEEGNDTNHVAPLAPPAPAMTQPTINYTDVTHTTATGAPPTTRTPLNYTDVPAHLAHETAPAAPPLNYTDVPEHLRRETNIPSGAPVPINYTDANAEIAAARASFAPLINNANVTNTMSSNATVAPIGVPAPINYTDVPASLGGPTNNQTVDPSVFAYAL